jgi:hypothetical protein
MYYVLITFLAVVVVAFAEAKVQFRRRSRAIFSGSDAAAKKSADTSVGPRGPLA